MKRLILMVIVIALIGALVAGPPAKATSSTKLVSYNQHHDIGDVSSALGAPTQACLLAMMPSTIGPATVGSEVMAEVPSPRELALSIQFNIMTPTTNGTGAAPS